MTVATLARVQTTCRPEICSLIRGIKRTGSPWNLIVAAYLLDGPRRFNQILQMGQDDSLSPRTLSRALKQLSGAGFVKRAVLSTQPFAVEYALTLQGEGLGKLLEAFQKLDPRLRPSQSSQSSPKKRIQIGDGHIFIPVKNLDQAAKFYHDLLGIPVKRSMSDWIDLSPELGISLTREDEELIEFHVDDFEKTAADFEKAGVKVQRRNGHGGTITDPFGNVIGIHDHRKQA